VKPNFLHESLKRLEEGLIIFLLTSYRINDKRPDIRRLPRFCRYIFFVPVKIEAEDGESDMEKTIVRKPLLYLLVRDEIMNYIRENQLEPGVLLPTETQLCNRFGISRGTLREAVRVLEEEGVVRRRAGVGTFICSSSNPIHSTLNINEGVTEMILGRGMEPGTRDLKIEKVKASSGLAGELELSPGDLVTSITRVRLADGVPVAHIIDFLPGTIMPETFFQEYTGGSLYEYLEKTMGMELSHSMLFIRPTTAVKPVARALGIQPGSLLMFLRQTDRDINNRPVHHFEAHWVADRFDFKVFRRRKA
jgi:GntR family transcriptional regulator